MTLTDLRCRIKLLGWELIKAKRESTWSPPNTDNYLLLGDTQIILNLNRKVTQYSYITDLQIILDLIIETEINEQNSVSGDIKNSPMDAPNQYSF